MLLLVKENESFDPVPIRFLSGQTEVPQARYIPELLAKFLLSHVMDYTASCDIIEQFRYILRMFDGSF